MMSGGFSAEWMGVRWNMSERKSMKLSDCCLSIADGDHQPPPKSENGIPFVTISNITANNTFDFSDTLFVPQDYYDSLDNKRKARKDDVLYSVVGSFGIPVLMKENKAFVFQRHIAILKPDPEAIVPGFLYYTMRSKEFYAKADAAAIGAAQRTVSLNALRNMEISLPELKTQKRIADILSVYDSLIETNQRQIKLLEEAAQRLYKEWFVDLRYPGHENVPVVDGVPEGWEKKTVDELCEKTRDTVSPNDIPPGTPYIGLEHIPRHDFCLSEWGNASDVTSSKAQYKRNDIIFGQIRPYFHKVGFAITDGVASTDSFIMTPRNDIWGLFLMTVFSEAFVNFSYQTCKEGAKMPRADWNQMRQYPIIIANTNTQQAFEERIRNIAEEVRILALQNKELSEARDRLLPKLMSGEIAV